MLSSVDAQDLAHRLRGLFARNIKALTIGFKPPYFYNRQLRNRLHRITSPALVIWGEKDNFVPRSHGETYAKLIPNCSELKIIPGTGHSAIVEKPEETAKLVLDFLAR